jgi:hypothetical protein
MSSTKMSMHSEDDSVLCDILDSDDLLESELAVDSDDILEGVEDDILETELALCELLELDGEEEDSEEAEDDVKLDDDSDITDKLELEDDVESEDDESEDGDDEEAELLVRVETDDSIGTPAPISIFSVTSKQQTVMIDSIHLKS